jgi:hypothetical protein
VGALRTIRVVWARLGTTAFIVFTTWSLLAFRATSPGRAALDGDDTVSVMAHADFWIFTQRLTVDAILLTLAEAERRAARSVRARFRG